MSQRSKPPSERTARLREARTIEQTTLGKTAGALSIAAAIAAYFATDASVRNVVVNLGAYVRGTGRASLFLLTYISGGCLVLGGIGLLARRSWGWWLALLGGLIGLGSLVRLYAGLFAIINPDHPKAPETTVAILVFISGPAVLYLGLLALLGQRRLRETFRISSPELQRRRSARGRGMFDLD